VRVSARMTKSILVRSQPKLGRVREKISVCLELIIHAASGEHVRADEAPVPELARARLRPLGRRNHVGKAHPPVMLGFFLVGRGVPSRRRAALTATGRKVLSLESGVRGRTIAPSPRSCAPVVCHARRELRDSGKERRQPNARFISDSLCSV
jgi:hypothetical protein